MNKRSKLWGIPVIIALVFALALAGCPAGDDGNSGSVGTNEVNGKNYYSLDGKIEFSGSTFMYYQVDGYDEDDKPVYDFFGEGSYTYNSDKKTITCTISKLKSEDGKMMTKSQILDLSMKEFDDMRKRTLDDLIIFEFGLEMDLFDDTSFWDDYFNDETAWDMSDDEYLKVWAAKPANKPVIDKIVADAKEFLALMGITKVDDALVFGFQMMGFESENIADLRKEYRSWIEEMFGLIFSPITYDYCITQDGSLLGQEALPANKGKDELKGLTYKLFDFSSWITLDYNFASSGMTYKVERGKDEIETGKYAYNSDDELVVVKPEKLMGMDKDWEEIPMTILEYYAAEENFSWYSNVDAAKKAARTNHEFETYRLSYDVKENDLFRDYFSPFAASKSKAANFRMKAQRSR